MAAPQQPHINRHTTTPDGRHIQLVDRDILTRLTRHKPSTIRARCTLHSYDPTTGRALYDYHQALQELAPVKTRNRTTHHP